MANVIQIPNNRCYGMTKFNRMYAVTGEQVTDLVDYLSTATFIDDIALLFNTPIENVVSLRSYPFDIPTHHPYAPTVTDTEIKINTVTTDAMGRDLGTYPLYPISVGAVMIYNRFNNFLDYAPYTKIELYLPYVGFVTLDNALVMGKALFIDYVVDLFSGKCTAFLSVGDALDSTDINIIMTCDGTIGNDIQIGGGQGAEIARNMLKLGVGATAGTVATVAGAIATGGASTAAQAAAATGAVSGGVSLLANTAINAITSGQVHITKGQPTQPTINTYAPQTPYLIITQPNVVEPSSYARDYGKPCGKTFTLGALTGFTVVDSIHVEGLATATADEAAEVERLLKAGVIL